MRPNYIIFPLIALLVGALGSRWTSGGMEWYKRLNLPAIAPPGWFIGIVWTIIYVLSTASAIILWNLTSDKWAQWQGRYWLIWILFAANAFLNACWSWLFFARHLIGLAVAEMIVLEATVIALIFLSRKFSKIASNLLIPYAVWVVFATYLAYRIYILNY